MEEIKNWREEKRSVYLYQRLSQVENDPSIRQLFLNLADEAEKQAAIWAKKIQKKGGKIPKDYRPDLRARLVAGMLRWFGVHPMRPILSAMKVRGLSVYSKIPPKHPIPTSIQEVGQRHKAKGSSGVLRAAVFGINDGLVSNASLILGIAGASSDNTFILLSGIAGLLAGAFSMGAGEYVSMRSQREMFEHQIGLEREELQEYPRQEAAELALIYEAKGLDRKEAEDISDKLIADPDRALDTLAREELGLNPEELGSPWAAAFSSFIFFSLGALIPLLPFLFSANRSIVLSVGLTAVALFLVGSALSLFTGKKFLWGGIRMLLIGSMAGGATYLIGRLLGVSLN